MEATKYRRPFMGFHCSSTIYFLANQCGDLPVNHLYFYQVLGLVRAFLLQFHLDFYCVLNGFHALIKFKLWLPSMPCNY